MKTLIFACLSVLGFVLLPGNADAYFTTGQEAFTVDGTVGVYTVAFSFGHEKHDIHIPVQAVWGNVERRDAISYDFLIKDSNPPRGTSAGVVLASLPIENGMYVVPRGKAAKFTLLMLLSTGEDAEIKAYVTGLPFTFDGKTELQLNPTELQYYSTDYIKLGNAVDLSK